MERRGASRYAWMAYAAICVMSIVWTGIQFNCMNLYAAPVVEEMGITRTQFMVVLSIPGIISAIISLFFFGNLEQRFGLRRMILVGGVLDTLAFLCWALMGSLPMLYLGGVLYGLGAGVTAYTCVSAAVNLWFKQRIGTLVGVANALGSAAGIVFAVVIAALIAAVGWRYSFALCVVVSVVALVAIAALFRGSPRELGVPAMYEESADGVAAGQRPAAGEGVDGAAGDGAGASAGDGAGASAGGGAGASAGGGAGASVAGGKADALAGSGKAAVLDVGDEVGAGAAGGKADASATGDGASSSAGDGAGASVAGGAADALAADVGWDMPFSRALRTPRLWILVVSYLLLGMASYAVMSTLPLFALDLGFGELQGQVVSVSLFAMAAAMVPLGIVCDAVGTRWGIALACAFTAVAALLLRLPMLPLAGMLVASACAGAAYSACGVTVGVGVKEALGEVDYSKKLGLCSGSMYVGLAAGPALANLAFDTTGTYGAILLIFAVSGAMCAALFFVAMRKKA